MLVSHTNDFLDDFRQPQQIQTLHFLFADEINDRCYSKVAGQSCQLPSPILYFPLVYRGWEVGTLTFQFSLCLSFSYTSLKQILRQGFGCERQEQNLEGSEVENPIQDVLMSHHHGGNQGSNTIRTPRNQGEEPPESSRG